ncbi:MAG: hypothetical protein ABIA02_03170 [Candidatus Falkowbacteria bacterium]
MTIKWEKIKEKLYRAGFRKMIKKFFKLPDGRIVDFDIKQEGPVTCVLAVNENNNEDNEFIEIVELSLDNFKKLLRSGQMTDVESGFLGLDFLSK